MNEDTYHLGIKALVTNEQGAILLLQVNPAKLHGDKQDYWDLPGGRVQKGDTVLATLKREVEEETGISDIEGGDQAGMVLSNIRIPISNESVGLILGIYMCRIPEGATITISDEHIAYNWFSPQRAAELLAVKYPTDFCEQIAVLHS